MRSIPAAFSRPIALLIEAASAAEYTSRGRRRANPPVSRRRGLGRLARAMPGHHHHEVATVNSPLGHHNSGGRVSITVKLTWTRYRPAGAVVGMTNATSMRSEERRVGKE